MAKLPLFLKKYFWEVNFEGYDLEKCGNEVIFRILEMGDERAVLWMKKTLGFAKKTRFFSPKRFVLVRNFRSFPGGSFVFMGALPKNQGRALALLGKA